MVFSGCLVCVNCLGRAGAHHSAGRGIPVHGAWKEAEDVNRHVVVNAGDRGHFDQCRLNGREKLWVAIVIDDGKAFLAMLQKESATTARYHGKNSVEPGRMAIGDERAQVPITDFSAVHVI
jgi:hypothetical protein